LTDLFHLYSHYSGATYEGQCGGHCRGTSADNIGILEFDTISETVIGNHQFDGTAAVTAPFTSPDGKYVVLPGVNNGKNIQILYPGANGELTVSIFLYLLNSSCEMPFC
jgi:hypothetical protein